MKALADGLKGMILIVSLIAAVGAAAYLAGERHLLNECGLCGGSCQSCECEECDGCALK